MTAVTLNGNPYNDGVTAPGNMGNGGHRTNFMLCLADMLVEMSNRTTAAGAGLVAASATSLTIGTGSKSATITVGKSFAVGMYVDYYSASTPTAYMLGQVTAFNSGTGAMTINVLAGDTNGGGTYSDWIVAISGRKGNQGLTGLIYAWDTGTSAADPGSSLVRANALPAAATALYIDQIDALSVNMGSTILAWANSTSTVKGQLILRAQNDPSQQVVYDVTGVTNNSGWYTIAVTYRGGAATFGAGIVVSLDFSRSGDKGDIGPTGPGGGNVFAAANGINPANARGVINLISSGNITITSVDNPGSTRTDVTLTVSASAVIAQSPSTYPLFPGAL